MVDLPLQQDTTPQVRAPQPLVSPGQIAQPREELAQTMDKAAGTFNTISVALAKKAAANDLINQKITTNADGSVNVENPATAPLLFGDAATAYKDAVAAGTIAQHGNDLSQTFNDLHTKYPADPQGFKAASDAYLQTRALTVGGAVGEALQREGAQLQTQHFNAITNTTASKDVATQKGSIEAQIKDQTDTAIALARQDGVNSPTFQAAVARMNVSYDALLKNPLFETSQDEVDIRKKNTVAMLKGEALTSQVDAAFSRPNGKAQAQEMLTKGILNNTDIPEAERTRLYRQGMSRLEYLTGDAKEAVDANRATITEMATALAKGNAPGGMAAENPAVGMAIKRSMAIGDYEGAARLNAAVTIQRHMRGVDALSDGQRAEATGVAGVPVNAAIGKVSAESGVDPNLMRRVAQIESGGRAGPEADTGSYKGLFQLSQAEFAKYGGGNIYNPEDNARAFANKTNAEAAQFQATNGRAPTPTEQYLMHNQGAAGLAAHEAHPDAPAWQSMLSTGEGQQKGAGWAKQAIWGNIPDDVKAKFPGGVESVTSRQFMDVWQAKVAGGGQQITGKFAAPAANGGPGYTYEELMQNPWLGSAYVRAAAADPEDRIQSARQSAEAAGKALDHGILPSAAVFAEVRQGAALYPDKLGPVADELEGRLQATAAATLPKEQRDAYFANLKDAAQGQDVHHINIATAALDQNTKLDRLMAEHPFDAAVQRGWTHPAAPIDPSQPESIAPALVQRAGLATRIGTLNGTPAPPLLDKDEMPKLQAALQGPKGSDVLASIAQGLKPDEMQALIKEQGFRDSVTGMSRSGDPGKMNAAYSFMDTQQKQNPLEFDKQFPDGLKDLRAWQANLAFYPPDVAAKRIVQAYDPAMASAREASAKVADEALKNVSPAAVVSKFSTGIVFGTTAKPPVSDQAGLAAGAMKADYDKNYRDGFAATGDPKMADSFAMEKLGNKYAVSPTNGNRVMANAPERYYPEVGGSQDWMAKQLDDAVKAATGATAALAPDVPARQSPEQAAARARRANLETPGNREYQAPRALVPDDQTERDIANGRPPSYQVMVQDGKGRWSVMTKPDGSAIDRFHFDPTPLLAARAAELNERRTSLEGFGAAVNVPAPF